MNMIKGCLCQAGLGGYALNWVDGDSEWGFRLRCLSAQAGVGPPKNSDLNGA